LSSTNSKKRLFICYTEEVNQNFIELIPVLILFIVKNITQARKLSHLNNNIINNIGSNKLSWQENVEGNLALTGWSCEGKFTQYPCEQSQLICLVYYLLHSSQSICYFMLDGSPNCLLYKREISSLITLLKYLRFFFWKQKQN